MNPPRYRAAAVGGCLHCHAEHRPDGSWLLRAVEPLGPAYRRVTDPLVHWVREAPQRVFVAQRGADGQWVSVTYAEMLQRVQSVAAALLARGLSVERPVAILSDNSIEHLTLALGAMWAGVAFVPVSPAYSLVSTDFGKLRHIFAKTTPGLVFVQHAETFERVLANAVTDGVEVVAAQGNSPSRSITPFSALLARTPGPDVEAAHAQVGPETIAKFLFTSGSTKAPKAVINTHGMMCANQQMKRQAFAFLQEEPPVILDWLPWNHTFGGNHNVGLALFNGGTFYIDGGKPTPAGIAETLRNLREISPTMYFNVPKGFEEIVLAMQDDAALRESLFKRVRMFMFAGAGLAQAVWDQLDRMAEMTVGERIPIFSGLGMTETAPSSCFALWAGRVAAGHIGLPCPGVEARLVPVDGKLEIRFRGPNVMPGYWRDPELTADAFDEEGFYKTGDAVVFVDPGDPQQGLLFDGRIAEDFKLSSGTFVSVGPLRAQVLALGAPYVLDSVVAGLNRGDIGLLVFPRLEECRRLSGLPAGASAADVLSHAAVRAFFQQLVDRLWAQGTGSANRVARLHVVLEPPSIDHGEITDKGSINQRAVLKHRADLVEALYQPAGAQPFVHLPNKKA